MVGEMAAATQGQRRRYARMPLAGTVLYTCGPNDRGFAAWQDISRGGACIRLRRYLHLGRHVLLSIKLGANHDAYAELKARVTWCCPIQDRKSFLAGLRVLDDGPETEHTLSELVSEALALAEEELIPTPARTVENGRRSTRAMRNEVLGWGAVKDAPVSGHTRL